MLPITVHQVSGFNSPSALVITGDLQYFSASLSDVAGVLLGVSVAEVLGDLADLGVIPEADQVGVVLTGDYYADRSGAMGASGPVDSVWVSWANRFHWVVGVQGNHDRFDESSKSHGILAGTVVHVLDNSRVSLGDLKVVGVGGIMGNSRRPGRRSEAEYLNEVRDVISLEPDILVLHESPAISEMGLLGSEALRVLLEASPPLLVCCGHVHWSTPIVRLNSGTVVVNADQRCVVLVGGEQSGLPQDPGLIRN